MVEDSNHFTADHRSDAYPLILRLSSCVSLLYLFGGVLNPYILKKQVGPGVLEGVIFDQRVRVWDRLSHDGAFRVPRAYCNDWSRIYIL